MPTLHDEQYELARTRAEIEALDLSMVRRKLAHKGEGPGWTPEHADKIERAYRQFLMVLAGHAGTTVAPTRDIDTFWHAHILDTRRYAADCQRIFGDFLHHDPYLGLMNNEPELERAAVTLHELFDAEFGEKVPANAAAWCGGEVAAKKEASWCGGEVGAKMEAAWCGGEVGAKKEASWCGGEVGAKMEAAWCGGEVGAKKEAAWCGGEVGAKKEASWCGGEVGAKKEASWCGGEVGAKKEASWCGGEVGAKKEAAWCGGEVGQPAH